MIVVAEVEASEIEGEVEAEAAVRLEDVVAIVAEVVVEEPKAAQRQLLCEHPLPGRELV